MWGLVAVWFITLVLGELLAPKLKTPKNNSQLEFPDNRQDRKIPLFAGTVQLRGPMLAWWGDIRKKAITKKVKSGLFSSTKQVIGHRYYGAMQLVLGHGKIDAIKAAHFGRKPAWTGSAVDAGITINLPELFGDNEAEGGVSGMLYVHSGDASQAVDVYLAAKLGAVPAHGGVAYCVWSDATRTAGGYLGNSNSPPEIWITAQRLPRLLGSGKHDIGGHANPAEFLYEMQVSAEWGAGMGTDQVDTASFLAAANTLHAEGMGIAPLYADATDVERICLDVLELIDGAIYSDIFTGRRVLVLARADYTLSAQPLFDETNSILTDYSRPAWEETVNEVHVTYLDATTGEQATVIAQDLANQQIQQAVVARTIDYPACPTTALAQKLAWRDLRALSTPLAKCTIRADRSAWVLRPGLVVRVSNQLLGIADMAMRVNRINYGTLVNGQIEFECVQDVFSLSSTIYGAVPATGWGDPTSAPAPALYPLLLEAPYHLTRADPDASAAEIGKLLTWAAAPSGDAYQYQIHTRQGADSYVQRGTAPFGATATLVTALAPGASSVQINAGQDLDLLAATDATGQAQGENLLLIDNEWISWRTLTDNGGGVYTLGTLYRGVLDTVPATHATGARVRFLSDAMGTTEDEYALTASVDAKYLPQTGRGTLALASASNLPITLTQRVQRPYPPADIKINGTSYPAAILGAYALDWKHRDRTQQINVIPQTDASIGPETGTTYTLRLYGETDALLRTETGLTGTSYTWTAEKADSGLTVPGSAPSSDYVTEVSADSPIAWWRLEETSGTTAGDSSGNGNHGTYGSGVTLNQAPLILSGRSIAATAASNAAIDAPDIVASTVLSASIWIKAASAPSADRALFGKFRSGFSAPWIVSLLSTGAVRVRLRYQNSATGEAVVTSPASVSDGMPHHISFTWDKASDNIVRLYVDGVQVATSAAWNQTIWVGSSHRTQVYQSGTESIGVDEAAVFLSYLTSARVSAHYNSGAVGVGADLPRLNDRIRAELESVRGGLASHQKHNITVDRAGYGYNWGNYWGGL